MPSPGGYCTEIHCYSQWGAQKLKLDPKGQVVGGVGRRQQGGWVRDSGRHSKERRKKGKKRTWGKIEQEITRQSKMENWEGSRTEGKGTGRLPGSKGSGHSPRGKQPEFGF